MIKILKKIFESKPTDKDIDNNQDLEILSGLMIEAAYMDDKIDTHEIEKIKSVLEHSFGEDKEEINQSINYALKNKDNNKSLHYYTSKINKNYNLEIKILLIETLWEIILADGQIHDYESSLIRRLSGLLYISDIDSGNARKRALDRLDKRL